MKKLSFYILIGLVCLLLVQVNNLSNTANKRFSPERWATEPNKREAMLNTFINEFHIASLYRHDILTLLGEPLPKEKYPSQLISPSGRNASYEDLKMDDENSIVYFLSSRISQYEDKAFYIRFDENQKVIDYVTFYFVS